MYTLAVKGTTYSMYINNSGQIQTNLQKMAQQVQVFYNLTQVFNQIPTLTLSKGFDLFSWLDPNKGGGWWLWTEIQTIVCLSIDVVN